MLGRRDAESLSKKEESDFELPSPDLSQISDFSPEIELDTYGGPSGWLTPESVIENQEQHVISQQKGSITERCKGESEKECEISRQLSFVFELDLWMEKQSVKTEGAHEEEVITDVLPSTLNPHHSQRGEDEADGPAFHISSSTFDLKGMNEEQGTKAAFARKSAPAKSFVCDSDIDEGLNRHPVQASDAKPHRQEDNSRQKLHSQSLLTDVKGAECFAGTSTSTEKLNLRSPVTQNCDGGHKRAPHPTSDSAYIRSDMQQPCQGEGSRTGPTVEQLYEDFPQAIARPGQCEVHDVHIQIFHDEKTLCLECLLWVKETDLTDFKDYKKRPIKPLIKRIRDTDTLHFRFATSTGHAYSIDQECEEILHASHFINSNYETFSYRIDPDPDDIKGDFVDINYFIRVNSEKERKIPIRIGVVRKKDSASIESPTMQFHAHNHCGNRSTVARTIANDNAQVKEEHKDSKSFIG